MGASSSILLCGERMWQGGERERGGGKSGEEGGKMGAGMGEKRGEDHQGRRPPTVQPSGGLLLHLPLCGREGSGGGKADKRREEGE